MKKKNWSKAKAGAGKFAANMGVPMHRKARKAPSGYGMKKGKK